MSEAAAPALPEPSSRWRSSAGDEARPFADPRSLRWRVNLGILPSSPSSSVDDLRRVTADSRRRYASLRRRLLVDPHIFKDGRDSPNLLVDNPLSQNPDSTWSRFFRNAELEKMVDQDLTRLYPEHGSYFQTPGCQGILRRILLLWCLGHPECGYRQGMHELLAPVLYVLEVDVQHLSQVRKLHEDQFTDKFDDLSSYENDLYHFDFRRSTDNNTADVGPQGTAMNKRSLDELDPEIKRIILLTDAYGAEGELGIVLSEKFKEHDAYCMFDALMNGGKGSIAMADFFSYSPMDGSHSGLPPVIEASAALYHLLSIVDSSLHSHLVELGVEPQYFALRWLRVLFGREFVLGDLLVIWDEIFMHGNYRIDKSSEEDGASTFGLLTSPRGAFIAALAVSMILHLRSSLLATEHATSCLQRLLNFPENVDLNKLIEKAKSFQELALNSNVLLPVLSRSSTHHRRKSVDSVSPRTPSLVPDSYWEEKWRVLHNTEELKQGSSGKEVATKKKGWSQRLRLSLSRTESDPLPAKLEKTNEEINKESVKKNLLDDLHQPCRTNEIFDEAHCQSNLMEKDYSKNVAEVDAEREKDQQNIIFMPEGHFSKNGESEETSPLFSGSASPLTVATDRENDTDRSSVASNRSIDEQVHFPRHTGGNCSPVINEDAQNKSGLNFDFTGKTENFSPVINDNMRAKFGPNCDSSEEKELPPSVNGDSYSAGKTLAGSKERKILSGKFQWFRKFGRNSATEAISAKGENYSDASKSSEVERNKGNSVGSFTENGSSSPSVTSKGNVRQDQNVPGDLKNLGQSMLEHIQAIESVFHEDRVQTDSPENFPKTLSSCKGQSTAMEALQQLRKISNLLSEM